MKRLTGWLALAAATALVRTAGGQGSTPAPTIAGVTLGAPLEAACAAAERASGRKRTPGDWSGPPSYGTMRHLLGTEHSWSFCELGPGSYIGADEAGRVNALAIAPELADTLFGTAGLAGPEFRERLRGKLGLPRMEGRTFSWITRTLTGGWLRDPAGWAIFLGDDRSVVLYKPARPGG